MDLASSITGARSSSRKEKRKARQPVMIPQKKALRNPMKMRNEDRPMVFQNSGVVICAASEARTSAGPTNIIELLMEEDRICHKISQNRKIPVFFNRLPLLCFSAVFKCFRLFIFLSPDRGHMPRSCYL